jgi:hypothetical protein
MPKTKPTKSEAASDAKLRAKLNAGPYAGRAPVTDAELAAIKAEASRMSRMVQTIAHDVGTGPEVMTPKRIRVCPGCGKRLGEGVAVSYCSAAGGPLKGVVYVRKATARQVRR